MQPPSVVILYINSKRFSYIEVAAFQKFVFTFTICDVNRNQQEQLPRKTMKYKKNNKKNKKMVFYLTLT